MLCANTGTDVKRWKLIIEVFDITSETNYQKLHLDSSTVDEHSDPRKSTEKRHFDPNTENVYIDLVNSTTNRHSDPSIEDR